MTCPPINRIQIPREEEQNPGSQRAIQSTKINKRACIVSTNDDDWDEQTEVNQQAIRKREKTWGNGEEGDGIVRTSCASGREDPLFIYVIYARFFPAGDSSLDRIFGRGRRAGERQRGEPFLVSLRGGGRGFWQLMAPPVCFVNWIGLDWRREEPRRGGGGGDA